MSLLFDDDPLTPEERKRINDIRSGEIIDATPVRLQSLLDYMIGKEVDSFSARPSAYLHSGVFNEIIASGSVVFHGIEVTSYWKHKSRIDLESLIHLKILIQFPNGDLNLRPIMYYSYLYKSSLSEPHVYPYRNKVMRRILRHINKWKKREGF